MCTYSNDNQNLIVTVDGGSPQTISIVANCDTAANCATALTAQITGASVSVVGGNLVITSATTGSASTITITTSGSGEGALALFGTNPVVNDGVVVSAGTLTSTSFSPYDFTSDNQNLIVVVDGGSAQTISVVANCDTLANCATALSAQITGATVAVAGNNVI